MCLGLVLWWRRNKDERYIVVPDELEAVIGNSTPATVEELHSGLVETFGVNENGRFDLNGKPGVYMRSLDVDDYFRLVNYSQSI